MPRQSASDRNTYFTFLYDYYTAMWNDLHVLRKFQVHFHIIFGCAAEYHQLYIYVLRMCHVSYVSTQHSKITIVILRCMIWHNFEIPPQ